jgi:hypothetical protein
VNIGNFILRFLHRQVTDRITAIPFARDLHEERSRFW